LTLIEQFIENDYNPFLIFDSQGKVFSLNTEAQFLLGKVSKKVIYDLATTYAPNTFGHKTTFLDLSYDYMCFFGISVAYVDEEQIAIKLYQKPSFEYEEKEFEGELVNIYTLVNLCISSNSITSNSTFTTDFDPSIPDIRLNPDVCVRLFNAIYSAVEDNDEVITKVFYRVGEHLMIKEKKYPLFSFLVKAKNINTYYKKDIQTLASKCGILLNISENKIVCNIPMITE